jgi:hypothetical protein
MDTKGRISKNLFCAFLIQNVLKERGVLFLLPFKSTLEYVIKEVQKSGDTVYEWNSSASVLSS